MEKKYKRDLNHTYLILELPGLYEEDYQMKMMQANQIEGLLSIAGQGVDGQSQYFYEISGKVSMRALYEKAEMQKEELEMFLTQFMRMANEVQRYLLDVNKILLEPEYIFWEEGQYFFCYLPERDVDLCQAFHGLTEYFVSRISHKDQEGFLLACELHKATMEENYNLEKIIEKQRTKEEKKVVYVKEETLQTPYEDDWIDYQESGGQMLRETSEKWKKIRKKRKQNKDGKWGFWDTTSLSNRGK